MASKLEQTLAHLGLKGLHPSFRKEKIDDSLLAGLTDSSGNQITTTVSGNSVIYTPDAYYNGPDNFGFTPNDGTVT